MVADFIWAALVPVLPLVEIGHWSLLKKSPAAGWWKGALSCSREAEEEQQQLVQDVTRFLSLRVVTDGLQLKMN